MELDRAVVWNRATQRTPRPSALADRVSSSLCRGEGIEDEQGFLSAEKETKLVRVRRTETEREELSHGLLVPAPSSNGAISGHRPGQPINRVPALLATLVIVAPCVYKTRLRAFTHRHGFGENLLDHQLWEALFEALFPVSPCLLLALFG